MDKNILLTDDILAFKVPSAEPITIAKGSEVTLAQTLGNKITILFADNLYRVAQSSNNVLGVKDTALDKIHDTPTETAVLEQLKSCFDPEIPVNIVDLGLIYNVGIKKEEQNYLIQILMTLTAPGCSMGDVLAADIKNALTIFTKVVHTEVEFTFDPPWHQGLISEAGKLELGLI